MEEKTIVIKKGKHRSGLKLPKLFWKDSLTKSVMFCKGSLVFPHHLQVASYEHLPINKLFGFSLGGHHQRKNSVRIGWNTLQSGHIGLYAYCYVDGVRRWNLIDKVMLHEWVEISIKMISKTLIQIDVVKTEGIGGKTSHFVNLTSDKYNRWFSYRLFEYFGGEKPAPHDITIKLRN